ERGATADRERLIGRIALVVVEVGVLIVGDDRAEAAGGRGLHALAVAPVHDDRVIGQVRVQHLVPGDHPLALLGEDVGGELGEAALEFGDPGQAPLVHAGAGGGGAPPLHTRALVPADVHVGGGEQVRDLGEHVAHEV